MQPLLEIAENGQPRIYLVKTQWPEGMEIVDSLHLSQRAADARAKALEANNAPDKWGQSFSIEVEPWEIHQEG